MHTPAQTIGAVFRTRDDAFAALRRLATHELRLGFATPGRDRASLGDAAVAVVIPGIGPAIAIGELATCLSSNPPEAQDVRTWHEALRRGCSVVVVLVHDAGEAQSARESLLGGEALDDARRRWEDDARASAMAATLRRPSVF